MTVFFQFVRRVAVAAVLFVLCGLGILSIGCQDALEIRLVPVFPADEPDLLQRAEVERLQLQPVSAVDPETGEKTNQDPAQTLVERGEGFSLKLPQGRWSVEVEGVDEGGNVVVFGKTPTFEVARGQGGVVKLFVGRSMAFNLVELDPPEVAAALEGLREHSPTEFTDESGHPWILVTGGRQPGSPDEPVALALLIDPVTFTVEQLPSLSCPRSGHTSFTVDTAEGPRVVLAGGDEQSGTCRSSLDVYDPISRTFARIDPFGADDRVAVAVPEIEKTSTGSVDTGSVIVPGNPRLVVDLLTGALVDEGPDLSDAPSDPQLAAKNSSDYVLVLTEDMLFADEANANAAQCGDDWDDVARFGPVEERNGGELYPLTNAQFLYIGGLSAGGDEPEYGWSLVSIGSCSIDEYGQGRRAPGPLLTHGFSLIDLFPEDGIGLLVAGGWSAAGEPVSSVVLMIKPGAASVPTFHELSSGDHERTIALRRPRAGHAAVRLPHDGTWWVIGGGDDARPEIFVRGSEPLEPAVELFKYRRRPPLTSMTVVDTTPGTHAFLSDVATTYPAELYAEQAQFSTVVFVTAAADRGIKDGAFAPAVNSLGCDEISEPSYTLVASGVVPNQDQLEESYDAGVVDVIPYEGESQPPPATLEKAVDKLTELADNDTGCAWRQLLKVGLDGLALTQPGGDFDPGVPVRLGVNVLVMVTSDDDCSQNIYGQGTPPDEVSEVHCTDPAAATAFDEYFGLPPFGDFVDEFDPLFDGLTWDNSDLIVAVVGNTSHDDPADCQASGYGDLHRPRRLIETVEYIEDTLGAQAQLVDVCGGGDKPPLVQALEAVGDRIRKQNPWQTCVPVGVTGVEPDREDDMLVAVQPDDDKAQQVKQDVSARCWVVHTEDAEPPDFCETEDVWRGVALPASAWRIAANFDGKTEGDCDWIVRLDPFEDSNGKDVDNAELVCLP